MIATFTPAVRTPYSFEDMAYAIEVGLQSLLGKKPSRETLSVAIAKCRLETGNGLACWNNNLGNVKRPPSEGGMYTAIELNEVIDGKVVWFSPRGRLDRKGGAVVAERFDAEPWHPQTRMAALANRVAAGHFYVDFVAKKKRYEKAWQALLSGNPELYARYLGEAGYYTAPIPEYTAGVVKLATQSLAKLNGKPHEEIVVKDRSNFYNQIVLDRFVAAESDRMRDEGANGGRALLDYEAHDTDPSELAPESGRGLS